MPGEDKGMSMKNLQAIEKSGGKVLEHKHPIGPHGFRAIVLDSEGNRIALYSPSALRIAGNEK